MPWIGFSPARAAASRELPGGGQVAVVGDGDGFLTVRGRGGAHRVELLESVPMAVGGVVVQVDERLHG